MKTNKSAKGKMVTLQDIERKSNKGMQAIQTVALLELLAVNKKVVFGLRMIAVLIAVLILVTIK